MLLALDIGNTNVTAGIIDNSEIKTIHRIDSSKSADAGLNSMDLTHINKIIIMIKIFVRTSNN